MNIILIVIINIVLMILISAGIKYFNKQDKISEARERASKQYRRANGRFSDIEAPKVFANSKRKIKVTYYGKEYYV